MSRAGSPNKAFSNRVPDCLPPHCVLIGLAGQGKTRGIVAKNVIELSTNQSIAAILPNPGASSQIFCTIALTAGTMNSGPCQRGIADEVH